MLRHFSSRLSNALAYIVYAEIVGQFDTTSYHALRMCLQPASADRSPRRLFSAVFKCNTHAGRTWHLHDIISQRVVIKGRQQTAFARTMSTMKQDPAAPPLLTTQTGMACLAGQ